MSEDTEGTAELATEGTAELATEGTAELADLRSMLQGMERRSNAKLDEIHKLVNSRLSETLTQLTEANSKIDHLNERIYQLTGEEPDDAPVGPVAE